MFHKTLSKIEEVLVESLALQQALPRYNHFDHNKLIQHDLVIQLKQVN